MREILDDVDPNELRPLFKDAFRQLQRGKALEKMVFIVYSPEVCHSVHVKVATECT
jgi:hypothetical protein